MNRLVNRQPWTAGTCPRFGCAMRHAGPGGCFHRAAKAASCRRSPKSRCSIHGSWAGLATSFLAGLVAARLVASLRQVTRGARR